MEPIEIQSTLRQEIIESQKTQAEFIKWKLIAVAAVSSISFGFSGGECVDTSVSKLLLCTIPLICAYTDFISLHVMIRIVTIGAYLRKIGSQYEKFVFSTRERGANPFIFETAALHGSSLIFNLILFVLSFYLPGNEWPNHAYRICGIVGSFVAVIIWVLYIFRAKRVQEMPI